MDKQELLDEENRYLSLYHGMELWPDINLPYSRENENGILFYVYYLILKNEMYGIDSKDKDIFNKIISNIRTYDKDSKQIYGLYDRGDSESLNPSKDKIRTISHDNISAIACSKFAHSTPENCFIYKHGVKNLWRFDNVYPEKPRWSRIMLPRDVILWSYLAGKIPQFLLIFPVFSCIISCVRSKKYRPALHKRLITFFKTGTLPPITSEDISTSGKLLSLMRLYSIKNTFIGKLGFKICTYFINKHFDEGWKFVFNYYFKNHDHPINKLAAEAYVKNGKQFIKF